jgi:energy-coupling factor transporter ATP-binding protein EcfA2
MSENKPIVTVENLTYSYPDSTFKALDDLTFSIDDGDFAIVIGPSGSGKSTLLQTLNGIIPQLKGGELTGRIIINDIDIQQHAVNEISEHIGMVFQDAESQLTSVFVKDEVAFGLENLNMDKDEILKRVDSAMKYVGLDLHGDKYVYEMSGGQVQRLAIASVLATDSKILVMDDPTANLDPVGTAEVLEVIKALRKEGRTVILATHWLDEFIHLATKLIVINNGKLVCCDEPKKALREYGKHLADDLGVWVPQLLEVDVAIQKAYPGLVDDQVVLTVDEALAKYKNISFSSEKFVPFSTSRENTDEKIITVDHLGFQYPDGTRALKDINFEVRQGLLTGILGPNGSGKSTIASLMVGLRKPTEGDLMIMGMSIKKLNVNSIARRVGFVFQNPEHQFVCDTVRDEIEYSLVVLGKTKDEIRQQVDDILESLKLKHLESRHPFGLSGGEKRRLSVAVMLVSHPDLLILDEPTYGQDKSHVKNIMNLVNEQLSHGVTVLIITHDMRLIEEYIDDVVVLRKGTLLYTGRPEDMFDSLGEDRDVTLRATPLARLVRRLREMGVDLHHDTRTIRQFVSQITPTNAQ